MIKSLGIYVHVPFCAKKCRYCDFTSHTPADENEVASYFDALKEQIMKAAFVYRNEYYVDTIFFGGGTPSFVKSDYITSTLACIKQNWNVAKDAEISLEANPGTIDKFKLRDYRRAGFNRISIGVQSFDNSVLWRLGRIHNSAVAVTAVENAKACGFNNVGIDLMLGVPGQSIDSWRSSMECALSLGLQHISFYSLQIEEGTPLYEDYKAGRETTPDWEENRQMYHAAREMLAEAGYHHYEISNAAMPGFECRHNLKYWMMQDYLGFGESAWSFIHGKRGELVFNEDGSCDINANASTEELRGDFIFTQFRLVDGFDPVDYKNLFGEDFEERYEQVLAYHYDNGLLAKSNGKIHFTDIGLNYTNPIIERFLNYE